MTEAQKKRNEERDRRICATYAEGKLSAAAIGRLHGVGRQRVQQILKKAGIWKPHEPSGRTAHVRATIKPETRQALEELAGDEESVSKLVSDTLDDLVESKKATEQQ